MRRELKITAHRAFTMNARVAFYMGDVNQRLGNTKDARAAYEHVLGLTTEDDWYHKESKARLAKLGG